jgi:broad specificity phosphatase PhoE
MKVYFIRHGESEYNAKKLFQHGDVSLSEKGRKQAEFLAKRLAKIPIDLIVSSSCARAEETTEIINKKLKKKIIFSELIGEKKMPTESIGKYAFSDEVIKIRKAMRKNAGNPDWHYSNEENFSEFKSRIKKFFEYLNNLKEKNILVVSHGGPIRMTILFMMFGNDFEPEIYYKFIDVFRLTNTGITLCEKEESGHWNLWAFNDHSHLG